jgi:hypothetical protein
MSTSLTIVPAYRVGTVFSEDFQPFRCWIYAEGERWVAFLKTRLKADFELKPHSKEQHAQPVEVDLFLV